MVKSFFIDFWGDLYRAGVDISNLFFIRRVCLDNQSSSVWKEFRLRFDWTYKIYTVVTLEEEFLDKEESIKKMILMQKVMPIFDYLTELGLQELIQPKFKELEEGNYLLFCRKIFFGIDWRLFVRGGIWGAIIYFLYPYLPQFYNYILGIK